VSVCPSVRREGGCREGGSVCLFVRPSVEREALCVCLSVRPSVEREALCVCLSVRL